MELFWKAAAAVMISLILAITIGKSEKDTAAVLTMGVCAVTALAALHYLRPVLELFGELEHTGNLDTGMLRVLLNTAGIALTSEVLESLCADAGHGALGKILQVLSSSAILYLSIPVFQTFLNGIGDILGAL